jgi:hypothetical protein
MPWPQPTDYNEAIQNPRGCFRDAELRAAQPVLNPLGLPLPHSGSFADVYQLRCPTTQRAWAVKCFTREVPGLEQRYAAISLHLQRARLPFTIDFQYLHEGISIRGLWFPVVKMRWIEGQPLNAFVGAHLDRPALLNTLAQLWVRMARELRDAEVAHGDLQHGNVLLVAGSQATTLAVRLIDYDGMYVPALLKQPSGEVGHPNFQHPERVREGRYGFEIDRFSHLVVYTALRALAVGGQSLWNRFDTGDNLLFKESDFRQPGGTVFQALWDMGEPAVRDLAGRLLLATQGGFDLAPLVTDVVTDAGVLPLSPTERTKVLKLLAVETTLPTAERVDVQPHDPKQPWWENATAPTPGSSVLPKPPPPPPSPRAQPKPKSSPDVALKERLEKKRKRQQRGGERTTANLFLGLGLLAVLCLLVLGVVAAMEWSGDVVVIPNRPPPQPAPPGYSRVLDEERFAPFKPGIAARPPNTGSGATAARYPGLLAELFADADRPNNAESRLKALSKTRVDPRIDFRWGQGPPEPGFKQDFFSIRWTGWLRVPASGRYSFTVNSEDGARLLIDGQEVLARWSARQESGAQPATGARELSEGEHEIKLEYFAMLHNAEIQLSWEGPGVTAGIIPQEFFSHDAGQRTRLGSQAEPRADAPSDGDRPKLGAGAGGYPGQPAGGPGGTSLPGAPSKSPGSGAPSSSSGNRPTSSTNPRNPFGVTDVPDPEGADVVKFAAATIWNTKPDDPNVSWMPPPSEGDPASLEGAWHCRWDNRKKDWTSGTAQIKVVADKVYILAQDSNTRSLIEARRTGTRLAGRWLNLSTGQNSPWVGLVQDNQRIDGSWSGGRLDFKRQVR